MTNIIPASQIINITLIPYCESYSSLNSENYYDLVQFTFDYSPVSNSSQSNKVVGELYVVCSEKYRPNRFDPSLFFLLIGAIICLYFMCRFREIISFETDFTGFRVTWLYALVYILLFSLVILVA